MPPKSRFTRLDAFAKTVEDARVRTTSGGIVTLVSLLIVVSLIWGEWAEYRRVVILPELVVDKGRGERMEIHLNITFPNLPCELTTLDVMDSSGELQTGVVHGVSKVRLGPAAEGGRVIDVKSLELHTQDDATHLDPDYCGDCYGAPSPPTAKKPGCCNSCDEVRDAYANVNWGFSQAKKVTQCEEEGYSEKLEAQRREGCRVEGIIRVNKVVGNFHIAPGRSFTRGHMHAHDLNSYFGSPDDAKHTMEHEIHHLRFGPQLPDELSQRWKWTSHHHTNPLDSTKQATNDPSYMFQYFVKVVSTSYLPLGWDATTASDIHTSLESRDIPLGMQGAILSDTGSIETHQYSVTSHRRSFRGGDDSEEGHSERVHASGGIPSVFFNYDISPMKVINREAKTKTFAGFLTGVCAVIGGTLTVAAAVDRGLYEGVAKMKKLHKS